MGKSPLTSARQFWRQSWLGSGWAGVEATSAQGVAWQCYQARSYAEAAARIREVAHVVGMLSMFMWLMHSFCSWTSSCEKVLGGLAVNVILYFVANLQKVFPSMGPICFQCIVLAYIYIACFAASLLHEGDIMRHRSISTSLVCLTIGSGQLLNVPMDVFALVVSGLHTGVWLFWHWYFNFLFPPVVAFGLICPAYSIYLANLRMRDQYNLCQAMERAKKSCWHATNMQSVLLKMVDGQNDASCFCAADGTILSAKPQLADILNAGDCITDCNLCSFANSQQERHRLCKFVEDVRCQQTNQVQQLPVTFRRCGPRPSSVEVVLFGIALPQSLGEDEADGGSASQTRLLVGVKLLKHNTGNQENVVNSADTQTQPASSKPDHVRSRVLDLSGVDDHTEAPSNFDAKGLMEAKMNLQAKFENRSNESDDCFFSNFPEDTTRQLHLHLHSAAGSVASDSRQGVGQLMAASELSFSLSTATVNTTALPRETRDACVQTILVILPVDSTVIQRAPPGTDNSQLRRRPPLPHQTSRVVLNTSQRVMKQFKVTPKVSVKQLIVEVICKINPEGKGCCFWHIALQVFLRATSEMISQNCDQLQPNDAWQCMYCLVMHSEESDDEEEGSDVRNICSSCQQPNTSADEDEATAQPEYSSANAADNEHA